MPPATEATCPQPSNPNSTTTTLGSQLFWEKETWKAKKLLATLGTGLTTLKWQLVHIWLAQGTVHVTHTLTVLPRPVRKAAPPCLHFKEQETQKDQGKAFTTYSQKSIPASIRTAMLASPFPKAAKEPTRLCMFFLLNSSDV